jgi:hypothetical protein
MLDFSTEVRISLFIASCVLHSMIYDVNSPLFRSFLVSKGGQKQESGSSVRIAYLLRNHDD